MPRTSCGWTSRSGTTSKQLKTIITQIAPQLLELIGVGPVVAAQLIVSYSHHGRCRDEAAFAALAGASPVQASSGRITRHRLNRGGDRQLNRALHIIAVTRAQHDPRTQAYIQRRSADLSARRSAACSSGTSPAKCSSSCAPSTR